jgi:hypothetical protein
MVLEYRVLQYRYLTIELWPYLSQRGTQYVNQPFTYLTEVILILCVVTIETFHF